MRKGFTLIEMLVVIAIIAIFSAIMFPTYTTGKYGAQSKMCLDNIKMINLAIINYAQDYDEKLPGERGTDWNVALFDYLIEPKKKLECPSSLSSYGLQRKFDSKLPQDQILIAEAEAVSSLCALPTSPHGKNRNTFTVGYLDGHAKRDIPRWGSTWDQVERGIYKPIFPPEPTQLAAR